MVRDIRDPRTIKSTREVAQAFLWRAEDPQDDPNHFANDERIPRIVRALERLGVTHIDNVLGAGSFGLASLLPDGNVMKLTSDPAEVQVGVALMGKNLPHVVAIYGSWFMRGVKVTFATALDPSGEPVFEIFRCGVLMEQAVIPLSREGVGTMLTRFIYYWKNETGNHVKDYRGLSETQKREKLRVASWELEEALHEEAQRFRRMIEAYTEPGAAVDMLTQQEKLYTDIAKAISELRSVGVYAIDFHGGNVGYDARTSDYRVFDVGVGSPPPEAKAPEIIPTGPEQTSFPHGEFHGGLREGLVLANVLVPQGTVVGEL
jgi:hypothetical protein